MTTELRPIPGYSRYFANVEGQLFSTCSGSLKRLKGAVRWGPRKLDKYLVVALREPGKKKTNSYVHQHVAAAWHGPSKPGQEVRHLNGNSLDNRVDNLAWGTRKENAHDRFLHGTSNIGARNGGAKLSETEARQVLLRSRAGEKDAALAEEYGVAEKSIYKLRTGRKWRHLHQEERA